mmetsp:Transcript_32545/g.107304  ORF Transcript_32545/g.107304 Transcript_32545/m.107304 type:complete len:111 (-) Transcript_32545:282-614(-)
MAEEELAGEQLCCIYTRVELVGDLGAPELLTYDGSVERLDGADLMAAGQAAMDATCGMSMGSKDCSEGRGCMEAAALRQNISGLSSTKRTAPVGYLASLALPTVLVGLGT